MNNNWLTKRMFQNALKRGKIFLTKENISRHDVTGYNVYIFHKNQMKLIKGLSSSWSDMFEAHRPHGTGYNKPQDIIESIAFSLGIKKIKHLNYRVI